MYNILKTMVYVLRYIRVDLTDKLDMGTTPLQLSACCYEEEQKPFKFLSKGVIGKLGGYFFLL